MTYVGATPKTGDFKKLDSITTSSATTFNLRQGGVAVYPESANHCIVSLNGVIQAPGDAFNIVNDTVVFSSSLASSDVINFFLVLGNVNDIGTVSDDTVSTAKLQANAVTTAKITDGNVTAAKIASGVVPTLRPNAKPLIVNGNMAVAQRSASVTGVTGGGYRTCDRMRLNPSSAGTWTVIQESLTSGAAYNAGFSKAYRIDCTTANASLGAASHLMANMRLEGQDLQFFKKGTSSAEKYTLAFWVKCNKTGTGQVNLQDVDNTRMCSATYAISSADTWEHKVLNFAADTTGVLGNDNGQSLRIEWYLDSGSNYDSGAAPTAWEASATADQNAGGNLNLADNTNNDWAITGIQLEVGEFSASTLPPYEHESYGDNLRRCQRYYFKYLDGTSKTVGIGSWWNDANIDTVIHFPVTMRTDPSLSATNGTNYYYICVAGNCRNISNSWTAGRTNPTSSQIYLAPDATDTAGRAGLVASTSASAFIAWDSEL